MENLSRELTSIRKNIVSEIKNSINGFHKSLERYKEWLSALPNIGDKKKKEKKSSTHRWNMEEINSFHVTRVLECNKRKWCWSNVFLRHNGPHILNSDEKNQTTVPKTALNDKCKEKQKRWHMSLWTLLLWGSPEFAVSWVPWQPQKILGYNESPCSNDQPFWKGACLL